MGPVPGGAAGGPGFRTGRRSTAAFLVFAGLALGLAPTAAAAARPVIGLAAAPRDSSAFDWPELHQTVDLSGYEANSSLSTASAPLGVAWEADLYGPALDSPVVAYDATLGEDLAYVGTETGYFYAVDADNGHVVWGDWLAGPVRVPTAAVAGGTVYVATSVTTRFYEIDATTGAIECSVVEPNSIETSPLVATPPGGSPTVYFGVEDLPRSSEPVVALSASGCTVEWQFTGYAVPSGPWDPISYAVDATGEPLVLFGTADPDSEIYAVDAVTGAEVWRFAVTNPPPGIYDVGAGVDVSPPGANGIADGMAYVPTKYGVMYALDLTTGAEQWSYTFDTLPGAGETGISTPALDGTNLVFGESSGIDDLVTGALVWSDVTGAGEVTSSPAIAGPPGSEVVAFGDLRGNVRLVALASGTQLSSYKTGSYVTGSPAVEDGNVLIASADGFLYDLVAGGGDESPLPSTTISSPADRSTLPNPNGSLMVAGTALDATALEAVDVAVQSGGPAGSWWDAATNAWGPAPVTNAATLAAPGTTSSTWTFKLPIAKGGGSFRIVANAVSTTGQADVRGAAVQFSVTYSTSGAHFELSVPYAAPGSTVTAKGGGFLKGESVTISLAGVTLATVKLAATSGSFSNVKVKLPTTAPLGAASLLATGGTSHRSVSGPLYVTNSWVELGDNATHDGYEADDPTLRKLVHPGGNVFLFLAWSVATTSAVDTSAAVADGIAYVGDAGGQVVAIDTHNGAVLWTWSDPSSAAVAGSPALDLTRGLLFVGVNDGTLDAISAATGKLAWSATLGGDVGAPVVGGGDVVVGSSNGTVESLAETTGAVVWSATLAGAAGPVALDTAKKTVVVGTASGAVTAFSSASGAPLWTFTTGGAVAGPPLVSGGSVFVGSADQHVYALSESTGGKVWEAQLGGAVSASMALNNGSLLAGDAAGDVYQLNTGNGAEVNETTHSGGPVTGLAAAESVDAIALSDGSVAMDRLTSGLLWKAQTGSGPAAPPAIVNGTVFIGGAGDSFDAFTPYGNPPI